MKTIGSNKTLFLLTSELVPVYLTFDTKLDPNLCAFLTPQLDLMDELPKGFH